MIKIKTTVAAAMLGVITSCTTQAPKVPRDTQVYFNKIIRSLPMPDTYESQSEKVSVAIVDAINNRISKEEGLREGVTKFVQKCFNKEETEELMSLANSPEQEILLAKLTKLNLTRKNEKISANFIGNLIETKPENEKLLSNIMTTKQKSGSDKGHYYSGETISNISNEIKSAFSYTTSQSIKRMLKKGFPEAKFLDIIIAAKGSTHREEIEKAKLLKAALDKNLPASEIEKQLTSLKLPDEVYTIN